MNWIKTVSKEAVFDFQNAELHDIELRTIKNQENEGIFPISPVSQFLIAPYILEKRFKTIQTSIPSNIGYKDKNLCDVVKHFKVIREVISQNQIQSIQIEELTNSSKEIFIDMIKNETLNELVKDVYFKTENDIISNNDFGYGNQIHYQLLEDQLNFKVKATSDTKEILEFIEKTYLDREGKFTLRPSGWFLEEELKNSLSLSLFGQIVDTIYLTVNLTNNQVLYVDLIKK